MCPEKNSKKRKSDFVNFPPPPPPTDIAGNVVADFSVCVFYFLALSLLLDVCLSHEKSLSAEIKE